MSTVRIATLLLIVIPIVTIFVKYTIPFVFHPFSMLLRSFTPRFQAVEVIVKLMSINENFYIFLIKCTRYCSKLSKSQLFPQGYRYSVTVKNKIEKTRSVT